MKLRIMAVGSKMPAWVSAGFEDYRKRLPREFNCELIEISLGRRGANRKAAQAMVEEGEALLKLISPRERVIALAVDGRAWSTVELAAELRKWQGSGDDYCLLIGGPDGLSEACYQRADLRWSLSNLTLPHPLVRVLLVEQLYRAWAINVGHPYHR